MAGLTALRVLDLCETVAWGGFPSYEPPCLAAIAAALPSLTSLRLVAPMQPDSLGALTQLSRLRSLAIPVPASLQPLGADAALGELARLTQLTALSVAESPLDARASAEGFLQLSRLTALQRLSIPLRTIPQRSEADRQAALSRVSAGWLPLGVGSASTF